MKRILILVFLLISIVSVSHSQVDSTTSLDPPQPISIYQKNDIKVIQYGLLARTFIIRLKTHPKIDLSKEELNTYNSILSSLRNVDFKIIDSMSITLKSGITWDLEGPLPQKPKNYIFKLLSKKGRNSKEMREYIKFSAFVSEWKKQNGMPFKMVDKFNRYYANISGEKKYIEMIYELKCNERNGTTITKREITFGKQFDED